MSTPPVSYTYERVQTAMNKAVDDILELVGGTHEQLHDTMNVLLAVGLRYLDGTASTAAEAIAQGWDVCRDDWDDDVVEHVLGWLRED